jgi:tRNA-specific 2-thiouridylase
VALHRAVDAEKDQSYVLAGLTQEQLQAAMFPLGDSTKDQIRAEAARRGLLVASKPDSHDICFIPDGDTAAFLGDRLPVRPGVIEDADGNEVGHHDGTWAFTVGQRRGLRLGRPAADGQPRYVLDIEPTQGRVVVGSRAELAVDRVLGEQTRWFSPLATPQQCSAQVRAHGRRIPAVLERADDGVEVRLLEPEYGVAPGQLIAFYDGDRVIGSARVSSTAAVATSV